MARNILASSLNNFIILNNSHATDAPYVTFIVTNPYTVKITIRDAFNDDGYYKEINGTRGGEISSASFNTLPNQTLNLLECIKLNPIFFHITLESANTIKAYIDTSIKYRITVDGGGIVVGGTYSSYNAYSPNKMVVMMQGIIDDDITNITLEKYSNEQTVSFNVTSPFEYTSQRYPIDVNLTAYQVFNNTTQTVTVPYDSFTVLPTTLNKFSKIDYSKYYTDSKKHFLTNNENKLYNYEEHYGISFLSDYPISIIKRYYTTSGMFLESETNCEYIEQNGIRYDIYDSLNLTPIENRHNHQVGYVEVSAVSNGVESYPVRFNILPSCNGNNELFFINELGGIDSFNFTGDTTVERKIDDNVIYYSNPTRDFEDRYEIEAVRQKKNSITTTLTRSEVDRATAEWLNELNKSKYVYKYLGTENPKYMTMIVTKFDIETSTNTDEYDISLEAHDSDNNIKL